MTESDLYSVLGVARDADADAIRSAYRRLARKYHPDVNPDDAPAEERFKEVSRAYDVLSDTEKRALYDEFGSAGVEPGFNAGAARQAQSWGGRRGGPSPFGDMFGGGSRGLEDLFAGFGQGGGFGRDLGPAQGRDRSSRIEVDFLDAVLSQPIRITLPGGDGLRVSLPAGAHNGTRVRLAGKGEPGLRGGPPGDLYLVLRVRSHGQFRRRGDDLEVDVELSVPAWIRGGALEVPTPEGSAQLQVPRRAPIDKRLRLRGKGATRREGGRGHLLVSLLPRLPEGGDVALAALADDLDELYGSSEGGAAQEPEGLGSAARDEEVPS